MLKLFFLSLAVFILPLSSFGKDDPVKTLIADEKEKIRAWEAGSSEDDIGLPPVFLKGDDRFVELYSPHASRRSDNFLCSTIELDELIELTRGTVGQDEVKLNFVLPRVRDRVAQSCLARPKDALVAVGRGQNHLVFLDEFFVRKTARPCSDNFPYRFQATYSPVVAPPLFFTTDLTVREGANHFRVGTELTRVELEDASKKALQDELAFMDEFKVDAYGIGLSTETQTLVLARRTRVSAEDEDLPRETLLLWKADEMHSLWVEKVNPRQKGGRIELLGVLDFNHDGHRDVLFRVYYPGCFLTVLTVGKAGRPSVIRLPGSSCACDG